MIDPRLLFEGLLHAYAGVGKTGKPQGHEHTVLAGIAVSFEGKGDPKGGRAVFVVLASGTKCLPAASRNDGLAVHDSHAEVLARRTMVRWLMDELFAMYAGKPSAVLEVGNTGRVCVRDGVAFHLVVSGAPCGDCSIVVLEGSDRLDGVGEPGKADQDRVSGRNSFREGSRVGLDDCATAASVKRHRTGAKMVHVSSILPRQEEVERAAQKTCVVRRKPGRGLPTSSTSCSDKILRWMHLGFQGCLMRSLLDEPLRFGSITAAAASQVALQRGVWGRQPVSRLEAPVVRSLSVPKKVLDQHGLCSTELRVVGAGNSVSWWGRSSHQWKLATGSLLVAGAENLYSEIPKASKEFREVLVGKLGYRAGCPSKSGATPAPQFHSRVSRRSMRSHFQRLIATASSAGATPSGDLKMPRNLAELDDQNFKRLMCPAYHAAWAELRGGIDSVFSTWIRK